MNTPIVDFVRSYADKNALRLHMPGHKGTDFLGIEAFDITEIEGADVLYNSDGIIKQSENNASTLFGTAKTLYSTEGSSLSIRAMLSLIKIYGNTKNKKAFIAAGRNAHKTFITAAALLDFEVDWLTPDSDKNMVSCNITPHFLENYLNLVAEKPLAVYVTSPDYLGNMLHIADLSKICKKYGILLLVDNAHGAYLKFLPQNLHPIALGADMCCDSAHKTLPVLTGGAYLHISKTAPQMFINSAEAAMSLFASTSPSYLIMQSLDMANKYMADGYKERLKAYIAETADLKSVLKSCGYMLCGDEPLKLTIAPKSYGYTGKELSDILAEKGIICEFADPDFTVMMLNEVIGKDDLIFLKNILLNIPKREEITVFPPELINGKKICSLKEAVFALSEEIPVDESLGRVSATTTVNCPPAIPIVLCGEEITENAIKCFKYYGIKTCSVIK